MIIKKVKGFLTTNDEFFPDKVGAYASEYGVIYNMAGYNLELALGKRFTITDLLKSTSSVKGILQEMHDNQHELIQEALSALTVDEYREFVDRIQKVDGDLQAL